VREVEQPTAPASGASKVRPSCGRFHRRWGPPYGPLHAPAHDRGAHGCVEHVGADVDGVIDHKVGAPIAGERAYCRRRVRSCDHSMARPQFLGVIELLLVGVDGIELRACPEESGGAACR
jgi:hypothetical protein